MKLLITGSSGFIGQNFINSSGEYDIIEADLLNSSLESIDFNGIDCVLHLAALVHQMNGAPEQEYYAINRDLALKVARRAKEHGVRHFVFMSTIKVYGEATKNDPWNEKSQCYPEGPYGKSKFEAEKVIEQLENEHFKVAIIRSPLVYGPGVKANMFNLIRLVDKYSILPFGDLTNKRAMVYVGNLIALIKEIIKQRRSGVFLAMDNKSVSTTEIVSLIAEKLNKKIYLLTIPHFITVTLKKLNPKIIERLYGSLELDNALTRKQLGFNPPFAISEGIKATVYWYKQIKKGQNV